MTELKFAAAAMALVASFMISHEASAQCWWNGYRWACSRAPAYYGYHSGLDFNNPATYGYVPRGLPHPNGPQPGGGGCYMGQSFSAGCGDR
jgi:hypothetical protein